MRSLRSCRRPFIVARNVLIVLVLLIPLLPATAGTIRAQNPVADLLPATPGWPAGSQADNMELIGQLGGHMSCIALSGSYAYVGFGPRMIVIDVSDPSHPTRVGETRLLPGVVNGIAIAGDYAYLAVSKSGLIVFSLADPAAPQEVGASPTPGDANQIAVAGGYAYIADGHAGGLRVVDVGDPAHPTEVGWSAGWDNDVAVAGEYVYLADGGGQGLRVVDVSVPATPTQVAQYRGSGMDFIDVASSVAIQGSYAYVLDLNRALLIVDITNPVSPAGVGLLRMPEGLDMVVAGERLFFAGSHALHVVDVADKTQPREIAAYHTPDAAAAVATYGSFAYVAGEGGFHVVDIANLAAPVEIGSYTFAGTPAGSARLAVSGAYAYVALASTNVTSQGWSGGWLSAISIADPAMPAQAARLDTPGEAYDIAVAGGYGYVADGRRGVTVYDLSAPDAPIEVASLPELGNIGCIAVAGQYAYAVTHFPWTPDLGALHVLDISNPAHPLLAGTLIGTSTLPLDVRAATVSGDLLYLANWNGLLTVDVSDPTQPVLAGRFAKTGGLAVSGRYAYLAGSSGLSVVDVEDPSRPVLLDISPTPLSANNLWLEGDWLYASGQGGLSLFHSADPAHPRGMSFLNLSGAGTDVAVVGPYAYVTYSAGSQTYGLKVITVDEVVEPTVAGAYHTVAARPRAVATSGHYVYLGETIDPFSESDTDALELSESGFAVVDISNPSAPARIGFCARTGNAKEMVVRGRYAYVASGEVGFYGLQIIDIADPVHPVVVGEYATVGVLGLAVAGDYAYMAGSADGLEIVDISDAAYPALARNYGVSGEARDVAVAGHYAYLATHSAGLRVLDVANPAQPVEVGSYPLPAITSVAVAGHYAYLGMRSSGLLRVIDIADPAHPVEVGAISLPASAMQITLAGWHAFVADGLGGVRVLNVADPAHLREVAAYTTPDYAFGVAVAGSHVYVADQDGGLVVLRAPLGERRTLFPLVARQ